MKISDYIIQFLKEQEFNEVFVSKGDACLPLIESISLDGEIKPIYLNSEHAGGLMLNGYANSTRKPMVMIADSILNGTGLINSIYQAQVDYIPSIFITGVRDLDSTSVVKPITKLSVKVTRPELIRYYLEKVIFNARHGRPGAILLEIPTSIQEEDVQHEALQSYHPESDILPKEDNDDDLKRKVRESIRAIKKTSRPIILIGRGIWFGGLNNDVVTLADKLGVPVVELVDTIGTIHSDHKYFGGRAYEGNGNLTIKNSDFILGLGIVDINIDNIAPEASKILVDVDYTGLTHLVIHSRVKTFIDYFLDSTTKSHDKFPNTSDWMLKTIDWWKEGYSKFLEVSEDKKKNEFILAISDSLQDSSIFVYDTNISMAMSCLFKAKKGQRMFQGEDPFCMAIGASIASKDRQVVCIVDEGKFKINMQELRTIQKLGLNLKVFVYGKGDNEFMKIVEAYGIKTVRVENASEIKSCLEEQGAIVCKLEERVDG